MNEVEILKRMCYKQTEQGWYKCVANGIITYQEGTFRCLYKTMSENKILLWKSVQQEIKSIQDLQRLEGDLIRSGTAFGSPWSDQLVPELSVVEILNL